MMDIPPRRGRDRPLRVSVDEEVIFEPQVPHSQKEPQVPPRFEPQIPSRFQVLPMPQSGFFPPMILEACQAYANF